MNNETLRLNKSLFWPDTKMTKLRLCSSYMLYCQTSLKTKVYVFEIIFLVHSVSVQRSFVKIQDLRYSCFGF